MPQYFFVRSKLNGLYLSIKNSDPDNGAQVIMWPKNYPFSDNQLWYQDFDTLTIRSRLNDKCLDVNGTPGAEGNRVVMNPYNPGQQQKMIMFVNQVKNVDNPNMVLDVVDADTKPGAEVRVWNDHTKQNQLWKFERRV